MQERSCSLPVSPSPTSSLMFSSPTLSPTYTPQGPESPQRPNSLHMFSSPPPLPVSTPPTSPYTSSSSSSSSFTSSSSTSSPSDLGTSVGIPPRDTEVQTPKTEVCKSLHLFIHRLEIGQSHLASSPTDPTHQPHPLASPIATPADSTH